MKIIRNDQLATLTIVPIRASEERVIISIIEMLAPGDHLSYGGRGPDGGDDKFCVVYLYAGARREIQKKVENGITITQSVHVGGIKLTLCGTTEEDKYEVGHIRDACYFGSGGLIFLGKAEIDGKGALVVTVRRCEQCGAGMINFNDCEWGICDACAAKCEHGYVSGFVHGAGTELGFGEFCCKCGRTKPPQTVQD